MIEYRTAFTRCAEFWFGEPEGAGHYDAVIRHRAPYRIEAGKCTDFFTLHVDLTRSSESIFEAFSRNTRAQIRKSIDGDDFRFEFMDRPTLADVEGFIDFYDRFADANGLSRMHVPRLIGMLNSGALSLTKVATADRTLTWHANVSRNAHVGLLFSASHLRLEESSEIRKMIGRANRRLHWEEMQRFKQQGREIYDFGGWYEGTDDAQMLSVNRFKEEFGGRKVLTFTIVEDRTFRAKCKAFVNEIRRSLFGRAP